MVTRSAQPLAASECGLRGPGPFASVRMDAQRAHQKRWTPPRWNEISEGQPPRRVSPIVQGTDSGLFRGSGSAPAPRHPVRPPSQVQFPGLLASWPAARRGSSSRGGDPVTGAFGLPTSLHCLKTSNKLSASSAGQRSLSVCPAAGISPPSPGTLGSRSSPGRPLPLLGPVLGLCFKRKVKLCCRKP